MNPLIPSQFRQVSAWSTSTTKMMAKKVKLNQLSKDERDAVLYFEDMNVFPMQSKFFNDPFRRATIKSFCRTNNQDFIPPLMYFLKKHLPMVEFPYQKHVHRKIIKTISNEYLGRQWKGNGRALAELILTTTKCIRNSDKIILRALASVIHTIKISELTAEQLAHLSRLSMNSKVGRFIMTDLSQASYHDT